MTHDVFKFITAFFHMLIIFKWQVQELCRTNSAPREKMLIWVDRALVSSRYISFRMTRVRFLSLSISHCGQDNSVGGAIPCTVGYSGTSLVFTHQMPAVFPTLSCNNQKCLQISPNVSPPYTENYCSRGRKEAKI